MVKEAVTEAISSLAARLDEQESKILELEMKANAQAAEIEKLREREEAAQQSILALQVKTDDMEQYSRRKNIRIYGIEEKEGESTDEVVGNVAKRMGVEISLSDIDRSHRLGPVKAAGAAERSGSRPIIVKFASQNAKFKFVRGRPSLKGSSIYLNEDLTQRRQKLYHAARHAGKVEKVWAVDGRIYAGLKDSAGGLKKKLITDIRDIDNLK
ncbi:uncharacterized protein LOC135157761 [Lytechinus pictus]|uniref:uncharacterized protein LOC135157761 n=1 Tax=Lytechinus pictus TaxID=7653 RepID=UPI0030BA1863